MEHNKNNHSNKFLDGFLWGFIIGGAVVFLIGTKKGKKLLKAITEEGMGGISDIIDGGLMDEEAEDDYEDVEDDVEDPSSAKASEGKGKVSNGVADVKEKITEVKPSIRNRFFRRKSS